jgi:glycerol uptake facilitator-like aquaporin
MSQSNEFSHYTVEVLEKKKRHFKKLQTMMLILTVVSVVIISIAAVTKDNMKVFQLIPFMITFGIALPVVVFGPIRKKIQAEIDSRPAA